MISMRKVTIVTILLFLVNIDNNAQDQQKEAWQNDLDYLVQRIEIMHPDPYAYIVKEEFHKRKQKLQNDIPGLSDVDIVLSISDLIATLQDGHTRWAFEHSDPQWLQQTIHMLPVILYPFKEGIYIMAGLEQYHSLVGSRVLQIGEMPTSIVCSKIGNMWSHDNPPGEKKFFYYTLGMAEMLKRAAAVEDVSEIKMELQDDQDEIITVQLPTVDFFIMAPFFGTSWYPQTGNGLIAMNNEAGNSLPLWLRKPGEKFWFEYIPEEKTMFLQINSLNFSHGNRKERSTFGKLCDQFFESFDQSGAEKMVIDIRTNTGGNHVEMPLLEEIMARPDINRPDRLFLITGRVTYSAAVHLTTILKRYTNITTIGEPPSGRPNHYGAARAFRLPNHPEIEIHCSIDYYQDSQPFDFNIIHAPDIQTEMSAADYRNNIDPAMLAVKDYDRIISQVSDIAGILKQAYSSSGLSGMKKAYHSNEKILHGRGYNPEKFLEEFYYDYLSGNKKSESDLTDYLFFAVGECPESIDLNYLLALYLESDGRLEEAKQRYSRCLELNPAHHYARMKMDLMRLEEDNLQENKQE